MKFMTCKSTSELPSWKLTNKRTIPSSVIVNFTLFKKNILVSYFQVLFTLLPTILSSIKFLVMVIIL